MARRLRAPAAPARFKAAMLRPRRDFTGPARGGPFGQELNLPAFRINHRVMIRYSLRCAEDHRFDSWFASGDAFESLRAAGMLSCAVCGSSSVEKALMAPTVRAGGDPAAGPDRGDPPGPRLQRSAEPTCPPGLSAPAHPAERALAELRRRIEAHSTYVGRDFARQARAIHAGEQEGGAIHGQADAREARALAEEGVPILPLPIPVRGKSN